MTRRGIYAHYLIGPDGGDCFPWVWYEPFKQLGCILDVFDPLQRPERELIAMAQDRDFVFFQAGGNDFSPETLKELRDDPRMVTFAWASDDYWRWWKDTSGVARLYNIYVTTSRAAYHDALDRGMDNVILSQFGANCRSFRPLGDRAKGCDVALIAREYGNRAQLVSALRAADIDVVFYNPDRATPVDAQNKILNAARIVLCPSRGAHDLPHVKMRHFEAPATGSFALVEMVTELREFYDTENEVIFFNGADDLVAKARHYLVNEEERERIAAAGYRRTMRDHNMKDRLRHMLAAGGIMVY